MSGSLGLLVMGLFDLIAGIILFTISSFFLIQLIAIAEIIKGGWSVFRFFFPRGGR